ncbi:hypothetical protein ACFLTB_06320 [Chloroflexota bacterium]
MAKSDYEKYIISKPVYEESIPRIENCQSPSMTFISNKQIPGVSNYVELGWINGIPEPNTYINEHVHDYDQIIIYWGGNAKTPQDLGAEIEYYIGGQSITFNTTTGMFIPKGTPHGPVTWNKFRFPHIQMTLTLGTGDAADVWGKSGISESGKGPSVKKNEFDYEQYVIRSPMREAGGVFTKGRQAPTMTYMSRTQINAANCYIEFGWIWGEVEPSIGEMRHEKYDEIVLHIGSDPDSPEDLGANMDFGLGGELFSLDTSFGVFIPRSMPHGPLNFKACKKPYIEMAIMLGAGTHAEGWADSFFNRSDSR